MIETDDNLEILPGLPTDYYHWELHFNGCTKTQLDPSPINLNAIPEHFGQPIMIAAIGHDERLPGFAVQIPQGGKPLYRFTRALTSGGQPGVISIRMGYVQGSKTESYSIDLAHPEIGWSRVET